jgi:hypothetical protein
MGNLVFMRKVNGVSSTLWRPNTLKFEDIE